MKTLRLVRSVLAIGVLLGLLESLAIVPARLNANEINNRGETLVIFWCKYGEPNAKTRIKFVETIYSNSATQFL